MKKILCVISLICFIITANAQQGRGKHFEAGFLLGGGAAMWNKVPEKNSLLVSVVVATSAGLAKECYDYNSGYKFDKIDLLSTVAGGIVSGIVVKQIKRKIRLKKIKHEISR